MLVPDDNSVLANSIHNNPNNSQDLFTIPFTDLKFQPNFFKNIFAAQDVLLVKNTDQVKITQKEFSSPQTITFKVLGQKKTRKEEFGIGSYSHELEIESFSLGIEGLPEISRIDFSFGYGQSLENSLNSLMKTKLYNNKLLAESVGKTFTMKVKNWNIEEFDNGKSLLFTETSDFDLDSFQEKTAENNNSPTSPPPKNNDNSAIPNGNKGIIIGIAIIFAILALIIGFLWMRKKK